MENRSEAERKNLKSLTVRNQCQTNATADLEAPNDPSVPFGGNFEIEQLGEREHLCVLHIMFTLQGKAFLFFCFVFE